MSRTTCQKSLTRTAGYLVVSLLPHPLCSQCVSRTRPSTGSPFSITSSTLLHVQATHAKTTPKRQRTQKKKNAKSKEKEQWRWKVKSSSPCQPYESSKQKREYFSRNRRKRTKQNKKKTLQDMQGEQASKKTAFVKTERWAERGAKRSTFVLKFTFFPSTFYAKAHFSLALMVGKQKKKLLFLLLLLLLFLALRGAILQDLC